MSGSNTWLMNAIEWGVYPNTGGGGSGPYVKLTATSNQIISGAYSLGANNVLPGFQIVTTSGGTTVLTSASPQVTYLTGTSAQTITLPDVTTLASVSTNTTTYTVINTSTVIATVNSFGSNLVSTVGIGATATFYCISNTGNTAASWSTNTTGGAVLLAPSANQTITGNFILQAYQLRATNAVITNLLQPAAGSTALNLLNVGGVPANYFTMTNATTGNFPVLSANGNNPDIGLELLAKGAGPFFLRTNALTNQIDIRTSTNTNLLSFPTGTSTTNTYQFPDVGGTSVLATTATVVVKAPAANQIITGAYALGANNLLPGFQNLPVTFATYQLTAASPQFINFTSVFAFTTANLPDVTTLTSVTTNTTTYTIINSTASPISISAFDNSVITTAPVGSCFTFYLKSNSDNSAAGWGIYGSGTSVVTNPTANQTVLGAYGLYLNGGNLIAGLTNYAQTNSLGGIQSVSDTSQAQFLATAYNNHGTGFISYVTSSTPAGAPIALPDGAPLGIFQFSGDDGSGDGGPVSVQLDLVCSGTTITGIVPSKATFSTSNPSTGLQPVWLADNLQNFNLYQGLTIARGGLVGGTTGLLPFGNPGQFEVTSGTSGGQIISSGFNSTEPAFLTMTTNSTVLGTYVAVAPGQPLGYWGAQGDDGSSYLAYAGYSEWTVDLGATVSTNIIPGRFTLYTTNSSGAPTSVYYADSAQNFVLPQGVLQIGTPTGSTASIATLYSTTTSLGSISLQAANNVGNFANVLTHASTTSARTWTLPDFSGALVAQGQALSTFQIRDLNGNAVIGISATASAVNYLFVTNNTSGNDPYIVATGADTDIGLGFQTQGIGTFVFKSLAPVNQVIFNTGTAYQHATNLTFPNTPQDRNVVFQDLDGVLVMDASNAGAGSGSITTAPPASSSASLFLGTAYQNTNGYDVIITVYLSVSAATTASILSGVGPTNTPTQQTIVSGLTLAALNIIPVTLYIPAGYYALLSTSGTITATISGQQTMSV